MLTRRGFFFGIGSALIASRTPTFAERLAAHLEADRGPLLEHPTSPVSFLDYDPDAEMFALDGDPWIAPDTPTWREYLTKIGVIEPAQRLRLSDYRHFANEWNVGPKALDQEMDENMWAEYWARAESPNAAAFRYLDGLDLSLVSDSGIDVPQLIFHDGYCPGNDTLGVEAGGDPNETLSLLQHHLNLVGENVAVRLVRFGRSN